MWQNRLPPCAVFTETSKEFAPHYPAEIRQDLRQTTRSLAVGTGPATAGIGEAAAPERSEDLQELWQERVAIIAADGHVPPAEAARLAWACLVPHDAGAVSAGDGPGG